MIVPMRRYRVASLFATLGLAAVLFPAAASAAGLPAGCNQATPTSCPTAVVSDSQPSAITATSVQLNGSVNPEGLPATCTYEYGRTRSYGFTTPTETVMTTSGVPVLVSGLSPKTTYHEKLVCATLASPISAGGSDVTFRTPAASAGTLPTASTQEPSAVTATSATLHGTAQPGSTTTTCHYDFGPTVAYGSTTSSVTFAAGSAASAVPISAGNLTTGIVIHVRLVCGDAAGTADGADMTLTTLPITTAPQAFTGGTSAVTTTTATLIASAVPGGDGTNATSCHFTYGTTLGYGQQSAPTSFESNLTVNPVSTPITGLAPGTIYHFQLVCINLSATSAGGDLTFTTPTTNTPQPLPAAATSLPRFVGPGHLGVATGRHVTLRLSCAFGVTCAGTLTVTTRSPAHGRTGFGHRQVAAVTRYSVDAGTTARLVVTLSRRSVADLRQHHGLSLSATAKDVDHRQADGAYHLT
jgi:hypothetical protein